jgi:hypothetical protein
VVSPLVAANGFDAFIGFVGFFIPGHDLFLPKEIVAEPGLA